MQAVLSIVRTGSPWRDPPELFGARIGFFRRFSRDGVWQRKFEAMWDDPDFTR